MSLGWKIFIFAIVAGSFVAHFVFLAWTSKIKTSNESGGDETTGHVWDEDLVELNEPLPRWWLTLFHGSVVFAIGYLLFFPGFGIFDGFLDYSQEEAYAQTVEQAEERYGPIFAAFAEQDIPVLATDGDAMSAAFNLYGNHCAQCHGSAGRGAIGFPNLTDNAWIWGGEPHQIESTILNGRNGVMPPWAAVIGGQEGAEQTAHYVLSLAGYEHDAEAAAVGMTKYNQFCIGCHGPEGKGNQALGAPNLVDDAWLYLPTIESISYTIINGRNNAMPAFEERLGADRVKVLAAYVYSLSKQNLVADGGDD